MAPSTGNMVVGFLLSLDGQEVLLVRKNRPAWQKGKLNGVGGHVEEGETPEEAMAREFLEETGSKVTGWQHFATLLGPNWRVSFYVVTGAIPPVIQTASNLLQAGSVDEPIEVVRVDRLLEESTIGNIPWLVHLALDEGYNGPDWPITITYGQKQ